MQIVAAGSRLDERRDNEVVWCLVVDSPSHQPTATGRSCLVIPLRKLGAPRMNLKTGAR
jgi:hypothetical protein